MGFLIDLRLIDWPAGWLDSWLAGKTWRQPQCKCVEDTQWKPLAQGHNRTSELGWYKSVTLEYQIQKHKCIHLRMSLVTMDADTHSNRMSLQNKKIHLHQLS